MWPTPGRPIRVVFRGDARILGARAYRLQQAGEPPVRPAQERDGRSIQGTLAIQRVAEDLLHALRDVRQRAKIHHGRRAANGMCAPVGLFEGSHVARRLLQPVEIGLDLGQVSADLIYKAVEYCGFIEVVGHAFHTHHCRLMRCRMRRAPPPSRRRRDYVVCSVSLMATLIRRLAQWTAEEWIFGILLR
jgi:hypothetical protein